MADLNDILTAQKNGVIAVNSLNQTWLSYSRREYGDTTSACVTSKTLVTTGSGYVATMSVVVAGSADGFIYDASSTENPQDAARLAAIPKTEGSYRVDCKFKNGLLIVPGAGQAINLTYSMD